MPEVTCNIQQTGANRLYPEVMMLAAITNRGTDLVSPAANPRPNSSWPAPIRAIPQKASALRPSQSTYAVNVCMYVGMYVCISGNKTQHKHIAQ